MKKVDNYALPEMISFQNNEIVKFWAFEFIFEILIVILKIVKYFHRILILDQYYLKSHTGNHTSVCFEYWYSVFCLGTATYTDKRYMS